MYERGNMPKAKIKSFQTNVAGVTFENRQNIIKKKCKIGDKVELIRKYDNKYDENAIKVCLSDRTQIGYLSQECAAVIVRKRNNKNGANQAAFISNIGLVDQENIYFVQLTVIEWDNTVNSLDAKQYYDTEKEIALDNIKSKSSGCLSITALIIIITGILLYLI